MDINHKVGYAVVGLGVGRTHVDAAAASENGRLVAVCDLRDDRLNAVKAQYPDVLLYHSFDELMKNPDVEAVSICLPSGLHAEYTVRALEAGKHVLCEKPITVTPDEFHELRELARDKNLVYTEAIMYLHLPERKTLLDAVKKIGKVTTAHFDFSQLSSKYPALKRGELPNIFNPHFATGCLMDLGIYCIYPVLDIFGEPYKITASSGFLSTGADGYGTVIFDYDGRQVTLTYSKVAQDRCGSMICGDEGTIVLPSMSQLTEMKMYDNSGNMTALSEDKEKKILMYYEAADFAKYIKENAVSDEYEYCNDMIEKTNKILEKIRNISGIIFK